MPPISYSLRKPTNITKLVATNYNKPILNIPTRWNSSYNMIERLLKLKEFCALEEMEDSQLHVGDLLWDFMSDFIQIFKPLKITTLKLQESQMSSGDFYKHWTLLKKPICGKYYKYFIQARAAYFEQSNFVILSVLRSAI